MEERYKLSVSPRFLNLLRSEVFSLILNLGATGILMEIVGITLASNLVPVFALGLFQVDFRLV